MDDGGFRGRPNNTEFGRLGSRSLLLWHPRLVGRNLVFKARRDHGDLNNFFFGVDGDQPIETIYESIMNRIESGA